MRLGQVVPNFLADTTAGRFQFYDWLGDSWCLLVSHPADFTPVCTSELSRLAESHNEFWKRGVKLLALSCDRLRSHHAWIEDLKRFCRNAPSEFPYPIISDESRDLAVLLDLIDEDQKDNPEMAMTVRSVYVIGPDRRIKLTMQYPNSTGRSMDEMLRVIDSLQLTSRLKVVATPSDWEPGKQVMVLPHVKQEDLPSLFPGGVDTIECPSGQTYIRTTSDIWREPWRTRAPPGRPMAETFHPTLAAQSMDESTSLNEVIKFIDDVARLPNLRQMPLGDLMELTSSLVTETTYTTSTSERLQAMTKFLRSLTP
ncbi:peroxiredoxin-6 [Frankliniella occidentalis]|uniref:1-Cys peroxiredoxin n=1 Tax=Frankliniella occidentalis TaxID=133901 RepID=A0A6J1SWP6_FRAOC|nr:peroxiredoxin-6 [Frankliniella occidentalis]